MTGYDLVAYPSKAFPQCHPDRLALMARMFGLNPAPPRTSRVLEIGCGDGVNLIASAVVLPEAKFYGIDLSESAIRRGRKLVRELGLKNVRLETRDLRALPARTGKFDYVIAHGLCSWVPSDVREALLAVIQSALARDGIAFVSYNAYPGAYLRQMVREMAGMFSDSGISQAREWLARAQQPQAGPPVYRAVLTDEASDMLRREDGALFHDDLAKSNQPFWFRDFIAFAATHGLQYVSEADLATTGCFGLTPAAAQEALAFAGPRRLDLEQYADFLRGRRFRQTLLCHKDHSVLAEPDTTKLRNCFAGGPLNPGIPRAAGTVEFVNRAGPRFQTDNPEYRAILESLAAAWPVYLPVDDFGSASYPRFAALFAAGMLDLRTVAPPVEARRGSRPAASPLARAQALRGASVTTLHHLEVFIESASLRAVLSLADGTRTRAMLRRDLRKIYPHETSAHVASALDQHLEELRQYGLLRG
ncbi:MAG: class I SAM-dependent methyltransferase [Acidobacteriota bacterium]